MNAHDPFNKNILDLFKYGNTVTINCFIKNIVTNSKFATIKDKILSAKDHNGKTIFHQYFLTCYGEGGYEEDLNLLNKMINLGLIEHFNDQHRNPSFDIHIDCKVTVAAEFAASGRFYSQPFIETVFNALLNTCRLNENQKIEVLKEILLYGTFNHKSFQYIIDTIRAKFPNEIVRDIINTRDEQGNTPLINMLADRTYGRVFGNGDVEPSFGNGDVEPRICHLLELEPDLEIANKKGRTVSHICASGNKCAPEGGSVLLCNAIKEIFNSYKTLDDRKQRFVNFIIGNHATETALHVASHHGNYHFMQLCLNKMAELELSKKDIRDFVNIKDQDGNTALHTLVEHYEPYYNINQIEKTMELLVNNGANPYIRNNSGKSVLDLVSANRYLTNDKSIKSILAQAQNMTFTDDISILINNLILSAPDPAERMESNTREAEHDHTSWPNNTKRQRTNSSDRSQTL